MPRGVDHYAVLGVQRDASDVSIRKRSRARTLFRTQAPRSACRLPKWWCIREVEIALLVRARRSRARAPPCC